MKKFVITSILSLCVAFAALAVTKSQVVVYIDGVKYYIHTVESKETIYSIAKAYDVDQQTIIDLNSADLKAGENIKIPYEHIAIPELSTWQKMKTFSKHKVEKGETLYSISRLYGISIETIIEDNPLIDPIAIPNGYKLLIRKKLKGKSSAAKIESEWAGYQSDLNLTEEKEGYKYHIVGKGETIYSLSKQNGLSEKEFIELNNLSEGLKAGAIVKLPSEGETLAKESEEEEVIEQVEQVGMQRLREGETLKVALLLPLTNHGKIQRQFADFYKGFEAGLDSVRVRHNRNIELHVYDTERSRESVEEIVKSDDFEGTDLIVGPVYEDLLEPVIEYAERHKAPIVSPLATLKESRSSMLFQLAPPADSKYDKLQPMLDTTRCVTLIYTEASDSLYESTVKSMMGERTFDTHKYVYANPTEVAELMKEEEESAGDLSKYINNGKENTIVVLSSSQTDVDRILAALSSAQINIVARGGRKPRYEVFGNSEWSRHKNIDRTTLFKNNVALISSYVAKRDNQNVKHFDSNYIVAHGALPSLYAYRGFDAAVIFSEGLYTGIDNFLEGKTFTPLQSHYRFEIDPESGVHVNQEWIRVNYKDNYKITIE